MAIASFVLVLSALPPQGVRVSPALPHLPLGDVEDFLPDGGDGVVFRGDCSRDARLELYRSRVDGSLVQTRLTSATSDGVERYLVSPGAQRVVYTTATGLYSVPLDGSQAPTQLAPSSVLTFRFTPDERFVLYQFDLHQLLVVPIAGGASVTIAQVGPDQFVGSDFTASADSSQVLYRTKVGTEFELHSKPITGGTALLLADTGSVADFRLSPDGREILFRSLLDLGRTALFRVPYAGGTPIQLNAPLARSAAVLEDYAFDRTGTRALFRASTGRSTDPDSSHELWIAPLDGSTPAVKLHAPLNPAADVLDFRFDGAHLLYRLSDAGLVELFQVPLDLSAPPVSLSAPMGAGTEVEDYALSGDGARAVFVSNRTDVLHRRLWSAPVAGGAPQQLDGRDLPPDERLSLDPDAPRVLYRADDGASQGLFLVPLDASAPARRLDGPAVPDARVTSHAIARGHALYVSSEARVDTFELLGVPLDPPQLPARLSHASDLFAWGDTIGAFGITPDGSVAVLMANELAPVVYSSPLTRPAPRERSLPASYGTVLEELVFTPDSNACAFTLRALDGTTQLFGASTRSAALAVRLDLAPVAGNVQQLVVGPNSTRVFFRAASAEHSAELFTVFLDGRLPPVVLNGALLPGAPASSVDAFELSPDGRRVLYLADQERVGRVELYSVRASGGPAVRLNPDLGTGEDVQAARITPDSRRAVFVSDEVLSGIENLYVAPLDGSAPAVARTNHGGDPHDIDLLAFTPDGTRALCRVVVSGISSELRLIALDGPPSSLLLDPDAPSPSEPVFTPDGTRVVYRGGFSGPLRSARLDGSELHDLDSSAEAGHRITADSTVVVYRRNLHLWRVPVSGSSAPVRIADSLGSIFRHELTRDGRLVVGNFAGVHELADLDAAPRFVAPLDATLRFLLTPEGQRVLSVDGELYLDYLTRPYRPR